ncbi:hypothetical protein D3C85_1192160 [compost metagenome]
MTGSITWPETMAAVLVYDRVTAKAVSITVNPTRIIERRMARGVEVRASAVSSETCEQASKPRKAQPPTAMAVRKPVAQEPSVPW